MCGIAGVIALGGASVSEDMVQPMLAQIIHRGPDGAGRFARGSVSLGMNRLAIIDVAGGQQPIWNETEDIAIVCNGEIYNHQALRGGLESRGHRFRTHSDVETILHLYEEQGEKCFEQLNGMFGCAIADYRTNRVVLARDPFGQKPLYYWQSASHIYFASELKSLVALEGFPRALSPFALASFLQFRYVPWPHTVYAAARKLAPGSSCTIGLDGTLAHQRYFQVDYSPGRFDPQPDLDGSRTHTKFREAVERHLMSERPLGVFLSGGLDSSAVVASMSELGHRSIHTYTVGFEGFLDNEFSTAHQVAEHFKTDHHEVLLNADQFWDTLDQVAYFADEPLADITTVPLFHLSQAAAKELVVVLSGEGSDELFAGYPGTEDLLSIFNKLESLRFAASLARAGATLPFPASIRRKMTSVGGSPADYLARTQHNITHIFDHTDFQAIGSAAIRDLDPGRMLEDYYLGRQGWDGIHLSLGALIEWWLPDDLLHKADRMTMAHSLELRCPFLDLEFAEHCARLPLDHKVRDSHEEPKRKIALKKAFKSLLPPGIATQRKKGFAIPAYAWLSNEYAARLDHELRREEALGCTLISRQERERLIPAAKGGDLKSQHRVWSLIMLNKWGDRWA